MVNKLRFVYFFFLEHFSGSCSLGPMYDGKTNWILPSPVTAVYYKKLERYLFHSISPCIPRHTRTNNCFSRNVQHTFHCSGKANWCMETEKRKKMISSRRAVIPSRSVGFALNAYYFPWYTCITICMAGSNQTVLSLIWSSLQFYPDNFRPTPPMKQTIPRR